MQAHVFSGPRGHRIVTDDPTGMNLPTEHGPWTPVKSIELERGKPLIAVNPDIALDDIDRQGWHITKPKISVGESTVPGGVITTTSVKS